MPTQPQDTNPAENGPQTGAQARDTCRVVETTAGPIRVHGSTDPSPAAVDALGVLVAAVHDLMADAEPGTAPESASDAGLSLAGSTEPATPDARDQERNSDAPTTKAESSTVQPDPPAWAISKGIVARHGRCGRWWTGTNVGHCSGCHREFSGRAFDQHQTHRDGKTICNDPADRGLVARTRIWGVLWGFPGPDAETRERIRAAHAETTP